MTDRGNCGLAGMVLVTHFLSAIKGEPGLQGPRETVVGLVGHHVTLPCALRPARPVSEKTIEWTRADLAPTYVYVFREGRHLFDMQDQAFQQRAALFERQLKNGNMSLKLSELRLADGGNYTCKLIPPELETCVQLLVGAVSEPTISRERTRGTAAVLKCESKKWFPEPEMEWTDGEGHTISPHDGGVQNQDGYFSICSSITVEISAKNVYTCTVRQRHIAHSRATNYTFTSEEEDLASLRSSNSSLTTWLIVFGFLILALGLLALMFACDRRRTSSSDETDGSSRVSLENKINNLRQQLSDLQHENKRLKTKVSALQGQNPDPKECLY